MSHCKLMWRVVVEEFFGTEAGVEDARDSFKLYTEEVIKIEAINNKGDLNGDE